MVVPGPGQPRYAVNGQARIAFEDLGGAGGDPLLLVLLPGVGHYLPAEVYPQIASEVRDLADRAAAGRSPVSPSRCP